MSRLLLIVALAFASCARKPPPDIPGRAVELHVAKCIQPLQKDPEIFTQELVPRGELRLYATPDLVQPLGGVLGDTVFGHKERPNVWAVLVYDFDDVVCQGFVGADAVDLGETVLLPDAGLDVGVSQSD